MQSLCLSPHQSCDSGFVYAVAIAMAVPNGQVSAGEDMQGRPVYPRTQYSMQYASTPRVHAGDVSQPNSGRGIAQCTPLSCLIYQVGGHVSSQSQTN